MMETENSIKQDGNWEFECPKFVDFTDPESWQNNDKENDAFFGEIQAKNLDEKIGRTFSPKISSLMSPQLLKEPMTDVVEILAGVEIKEENEVNITKDDSGISGEGIREDIVKSIKKDTTITSHIKAKKRRSAKSVIATVSKYFDLNRIKYPKLRLSQIAAKVETGLTSLKSNQISDTVEISTGSRVLLSHDRKGSVKYIGETKFSPGIWYGIELHLASGKNDGSVEGIRYFTCKPNYGLFIKYARILKVLPESDQKKILNKNQAIKKSFDIKKGKPEFKSLVSEINPNKYHMSSNDEAWLCVGMNVFSHNEIAVVQYIGSVDFAPGIWLGIEFRHEKGKNDGSVEGRRYFRCKPKHGLFVRPEKVSVRGINAAKLITQ